MAVKVRRFLTAVNESNCYLCWDAGSGDAVIIDPAEISDGLRAAVGEQGLRVGGILITHGHYDHVQALDAALAAWPATVYGRDAYPGGVVADHGHQITLVALSFTVVATPGHTDDSLSFLAPGHAFVGDALFAAAVGGTSGGVNFKRQRDAIRAHILALPDDTILHPGHGPATTVAVERCYNPFLV
jgi:glyoxylase-like metal-dependent hydrolase (beta-lactamase superfamily II)